MKTHLAVAGAALLLAACPPAMDNSSDHAYVTCDSSWAANGVHDTKCESACQDYQHPTNNDTCAAVTWDHTTDSRNTSGGVTGCASTVNLDGLLGCCLALNGEIDFAVCDTQAQ